MKNRKIVIIAFLLIAVLIVGVGYAALAAHLTVDGVASYNEAAAVDGLEGDLIFSDAKVITSGSAKSATNVDEATVLEEDGKTIAKFTVKTLATTEEAVVLQYTLTNTNPADVVLNIEPTHESGKANPTYFQDNFFEFSSVKVFADEDAVTAGNGTELLGDRTKNVPLAAGDSVIVQVTIVLKDLPESGNIDAETFYLHITATHNG